MARNAWPKAEVVLPLPLPVITITKPLSGCPGALGDFFTLVIFLLRALDFIFIPLFYKAFRNFFRC
jgi:hypothetical protein